MKDESCTKRNGVAPNFRFIKILFHYQLLTVIQHMMESLLSLMKI